VFMMYCSTFDKCSVNSASPEVYIYYNISKTGIFVVLLLTIFTTYPISTTEE
jgi:hypothetical protein